ncbi:MAG TPA: tetratricopeptide repeat protein [Bacteroidia bacterium]|nr:tetratricopeptide repeat protein [Bacteroidia bacterium]
MKSTLRVLVVRMLLCCFAVAFAGIPLFAQKAKADSCEAILKKNPEDRKTRKTYMAAIRKINPDSAAQICIDKAFAAEKSGDVRSAGEWNYYAALCYDQAQKNKEAKIYFQKGVDQLESVKDTFCLDDCQNGYGYLLQRTGEFKDSKKYLDASLAYREFVNDTDGIVGSLLHLGLLYNSMGDYTQALDHYYRCLEYAKFNEDSDPGMMGKIMNNIGAVYMNQVKYDDALRFYRQAIVYKQKAGNKKDLASTYNNIGSIHEARGDYDSALYYFRISFDLRTEAEDYRGLGIVHKNMGDCYFLQGKFKEAEENFELSLKYRERVNDQAGITSTWIAYGKLRNKQGKYNEGVEYLLRGDSLAKATGSLSLELDAALELWSVYRNMGLPDIALKYADVAINLKDSLLNESSARHSEEMRARYDMDQQAKQLEELKLQQREDAIKSESERSFFKLLIIAGVVILILVVAFFLVRARENRKSQNRLQFAYDQIETKNKDITDSIRYAKRIQQAILPDDHSLKQAFPDSFVFYRPKDIVSGDFYWYHHTNNVQLVAVADCTGHGVPGAFMSVLGASQLTSVIAEQGQLAPSRILNLIDDGIRQQLHQDGLSAMHDSMDIALCAYDKTKRELTFCGANRPIIIFRNTGRLEIFRPSKYSVGGDADHQKIFKEEVISLNEGDCFYLFTDGFADQFGGPKGKKFKSSRFRDLLTQIAAQEIHNQKRELEVVFDSWRGQFEQVDDICVIGVRV